MSMQAYVDDSGTKGTGSVLVLAGLFGTAKTLAAVADVWDRELAAKIPLAIRYFKAYEARDLCGEFAHWRIERRDEKVRRLAAVIDRDDIVLIHSAVDLGSHGAMEKHIGKINEATKHPINQPYLLALMTVMLAAGMEMWHRKSDEKLEVIFDEHVIFRDVAKEQWKIMREVIPEWLLKYMPVEPLFRDDKDFVTLQAADLMAGHGRMLAEHVPRWPKLELNRLLGSPFSKNYDAKAIAKLTVNQLAQRMNVPESAFKIEYERVTFESATKRVSIRRASRRRGRA